MNGRTWIVEEQYDPGKPWWPASVHDTRAIARQVAQWRRQQGDRVRVREYVRVEPRR